MSRDEQELAALLRSLPRTPAAWRDAAKRIPDQLQGNAETTGEHPAEAPAEPPDTVTVDPGDGPVQGA
jgi:hypothetical protein